MYPRVWAALPQLMWRQSIRRVRSPAITQSLQLFAKPPLTHQDPDGELVERSAHCGDGRMGYLPVRQRQYQWCRARRWMALNAVSLAADVATGGAGGGMAVRAAALAAKGGKDRHRRSKRNVAADRAIVRPRQGCVAEEGIETGDPTRVILSGMQIIAEPIVFQRASANRQRRRTTLGISQNYLAKQIKKAIASLEKQIAEHEDKIANPGKSFHTSNNSTLASRRHC